MTTHPMLPTNEQLKKWEDLWFEENENIDVLLIQVYQEGADAELDACCEWLRSAGHPPLTISVLHAGRRPKPPSLKEQALSDLDFLLNIARKSGVFNPPNTIREALEQLND